MDCKSFRKHHLAFVDDTLPGVDVVRMQLHLAECTECETWDQQVRRSLLVVRNHLGTIEPSERFRARLDARLAQEKAALAAAPELFGARRRMVWPMALGVMALATTVTALMRVSSPVNEVGRLPEAVVMGPLGASLMSNGIGPGNAQPAFIATFSSGMAILPALMLVDEAAALRAAADEFAASTARTASYVPPER